jgi:hypothetical protein
MDANASPARTVTLLFFGRFRNGSNADSSQVLVRLQKIVASALDDLQQIIHRRNFLELLGQEPLQKINRDVIVLLSRELNQPIDLVGDMNLLIKRKFHRVPRSLEFRFRCVDRRDRHASAGIHHIFDEATQNAPRSRSTAAPR